MKILLDTCTLLWLEIEPSKVPGTLRETLRDPDTECYLSAASAWELTIKWIGGRLKLPEPPAKFLAGACERIQTTSLPVKETEVVQLAKLPPLHSDPFDRILVCQAIEHGLVIATPDELIDQYPVRTIWSRPL